jgi:pimeloyl-ACP methyl ester carboxylesterase
MFTKYLELDDHAIHYLHTGPSTLPGVCPALARGELLLFLPAAGGTASLWRPQLEHFAARHSGVALDLPGHGRSAGIEGLATIEAYAALLVAFASRLALRPFVLVGRAMGSAIALAVALEQPAMVRGLVLVCGSVRHEHDPAALEALSEVVAGRRSQQFSTDVFSPATGGEVMRQVWTEQVQTDPRVTLADLRVCGAFDVRARLRALQVPTLVVAGADDRLVPPAAAEELATAIPGATFAVVPDAGHMAPVEQAEAFNRLVEQYLEGLS